MTRSNRTLNRLILGLVGVIALALAAAVLAPSMARLVPGLEPVTAVTKDAVAAATDWLRTPIAATVVTAAGILVALLAILWIATRGRGGTSTAHADADLELGIGVVRDIVAEQLGPVPAVLGTRADAHRLRGATVITLTVSTRRRADLEQILQRTRSTVETLDAMLGVQLPVVVRIRSGWRSTLARTQRAE